MHSNRAARRRSGDVGSTFKFGLIRSRNGKWWKRRQGSPTSVAVARTTPRRRRLVALAVTTAMLGVGVPIFGPTQAAYAAACPTGTTGVPFTWSGAASGNKAVWADGDTTNSYTVGTGATAVTMTMSLIDPGNRNADANHAFNSAPFLGRNLFDSLNGIHTKSNGAYGAGWFTFGIGTMNTGEGAEIRMAFDKPVVIRDYIVGDIDSVGYTTTVNNEPEQSYQDQVKLATQRGGNNVPLTITPPAAGKTSTSGQTVTANIALNVNGNLDPADVLGSVAINTSDPVTSFSTIYTNGPGDAALEAGRPRPSWMPPGQGVSDGQAIRMSGFTICVGTGSIGDRIWSDSDGDGIQDPAEPGLSGVTVRLKDPDGNVVGTTVTGANGSYSFPQLPPFGYTVAVDPTTLPAGVVQTGDPDAVKDNSTLVNVTGAAVTSVDFGYQPPPPPPATVSGKVYVDTNNDGIVGSGEAPISGTTITLRNAAGTVVATTQTLVDGTYSFPTVAPGTYTVSESQPASHVDGKDTPGNLATANGNDSFSVTVAGGQTSANNNFGERLAPSPASLSGFVYQDAGDDGIKGAGETAIGGASVTLLDGSGNTVSTTTTAADGSYSFVGLAAGSYTVVESQPSGYTDGKDTAGTIGASIPAATNDRIAVTLAAGQSSLNNNFGELQSPATISGSVYVDRGDDGIKSATEKPIAGVTINLRNAAGAIVATTTTNATGDYSFPGVTPGSYVVEEIQPTAYLDGKETAGTNGSSIPASTNNRIAVTVGAGESSLSNNFGELGGSIAGSVAVDAGTPNGVVDLGETPIAGTTVTLRNSANVVVATTTTDALGNYSFGDLAAGSYTVTETQPGSYTDGLDNPGTFGTANGNDSHTVALPAGGTSIDNDFTELASTLISGKVFADANNNGVQDPGEGGIGGVVMELLNSDGSGGFTIPPAFTTTTNADGTYSFPNVPAGTYRIREPQPAGYTDGIDTAGTNGAVRSTNTTGGYDRIDVTIANGQSSINNNYGEIPPPARIAGTVYVDTNDDGIVDGTQPTGEPRLGGVLVTLKTAAGVVVATANTDSDGTYAFENLPAGSYIVEEGQPSAYNDGKDTAGTNGAATAGNDAIAVNVASGQASTGNNFGEREKPVSISGTVFADTDLAGDLDAGEPRLAGVTVTLQNSAGSTVATTVTGADGSYSFTNLAPGTYTVVETQPSGYTDGIDTPGTNGATLPAATNDRISVTLTGGQTSTGNNFGEVPALSRIAGQVFRDLDNDGIRDAGEAAIPSTTISLRDSTGTVVATTTTASNGSYSFENIQPGSYRVEESQPAGYTDGIDTAGTNGSTVPAASNDQFDITLTAGQSSTGNDFAEVLVAGEIRGTVYVDANNDGVADPTERRLAGITVTLRDSGGNVITTATTDAAGAYAFTNLAPGEYFVDETQPTAYADGIDTPSSVGTATSPSNDRIAVSLAAGQISSANNFGERGGLISGSVVIDGTGSGAINGIADPTETAIAGTTVTLRDSAGNVVATTTTDPSGNYSFANVAAGVYTVNESQPSGYTDAGDNPGTGAAANGNDSHTVTLAAGGSSVDNDFTELLPAIPPPAITGFVYVDADNNGIKDPAEAPIGGVTLNIKNSAGTTVATTTTNPDGSYSFASLAPGSYTVTQTQPVAYLDGIETAGTNGSSIPPSTNDVISATVAAGETSSSNNFGERPKPGQISGFVYADRNNDGVRDAGESPIAGTTVALKNALGAVVATTTTGTNGAYSFLNLAPGTYVVVETQPAAHSDGKDTPGTNGATNPSNDTHAVTLASGESSANNNFGEIPNPGTFSGKVYIDANDSGSQEPGEANLAGITITLLDGAGATVGTTTTAADGSWAFTNLNPGTYTAVETQPSTYVDGQETPGSNGATRPASTNDRITATIGAGESSINNLFAERPNPARIAGKVYADVDGDGIPDSNEAPIAAVTLALRDSTGAIVATTTTGADGTYAFENLIPGTYTVNEVQPAGYSDGADTAGTNGATVTANDVMTVTLAGGQASTGNNFGERQPVSISGTVYSDVDGDGVKDASEAPIAGVVISLKNASGSVVASVTTAADGSYRFENLPAGTYTVDESQPAGWSDGLDSAGTNGATTPANDSHTVTLAYGQSSINNNFGERAPASLSGNVYLDANNDGVKDATEVSIAGVSISLLDVNGVEVRSTVTAADGSYRFDNIAAGTYTVVETQPIAYGDGIDTPGTNGASTPANDKFSVTLAPGQTSTSNNFGERTTGTVSGRIYRDLNNDGVLDPVEGSISGVTVTLRDGGGNIVGTTTTDASGSYRFDQVPAGSYTVTETQPIEFIDGVETPGTNGSTIPGSTNDVIAVTIAAGQSSANNNFGERPPATISGSVYVDANTNGSRDSSEDPIAGTTVQLRDSANNVIKTAITDASGAYLFENVAPGTYTVTEVQPTTHLDGAESPGTNGASIPASTNDTFSVTVGAGESSTGNNFGERIAPVVPASVSGVVYEDANNNGIQDSGEAIIGGVTITLKDSGGNTVATTTSDSSTGAWSFANLVPGQYSVVESQPATHNDGKDTAGNLSATAVSDTISVTLSAGSSSTGNLFGERPIPPTIGSISGRVEDDEDASSTTSAGDLPIAGVLITLVDAGGNTVATTTTDASGAWSFSGIALGSYQVRETQPTAYNTVNETAGVGATIAATNVFVVTITGGTPNSTGNVFREVGPIAAPASLSGKVYVDAGNDGIASPGEMPIEGVTITVRDSSNTVVATVVTAADGSYSVNGLAPGAYTISQSQPAGFVDGKDTAGSNGAAVSSNDVIAVTMGAGQTSANNNFGELLPAAAPGTISGVVWSDVNNNGVREAGEDPIAGVTVTLNGPGGAVTAVTDADGKYTFSGLGAGVYTVTETQQVQYLDGVEVPGSDATSPSNDVISVTLAAGASSANNDFAELPPGTVSGTVFVDADGSGALSAGDQPISGVTVKLTNSTGTIFTTTTAADGTYRFENLPAGTYTLAETQPATHGDTTDTAGIGATLTGNDAMSITLAPGQQSTGNNFGETAPGSVAGKVFVDLNNNGIQEPGENPISGVAISVLNASGVEVALISTGSDGSYSVPNLPPGTYTLVQVQPVGFSDGLDTPGTNGSTLAGNDRMTVTVVAAGESINNNFAERPPVEISGMVFDDLNSNGVRDANEPAISGAIVTLRDATDNPIDSVVTGADGTWRFAGLAAGTYSVSETQPVGFADGQDAPGTNGATLSGNDVFTAALAPGTSSTSNNFGEIRPGSIEGQVWADANNDGIRDASEPPLAGVILDLLDANGAVVATVTTSPDGKYRFENLQPGVYTVAERQPSGYADGKDTAGTSAVLSANDRIRVTIGSNQSSTGNNFGERINPPVPGSIAGRVFVDVDGDGLPDAVDVGIAGVTIQLFDASGALIATTTTDATGAYFFTGLVPGTYRVVESQPAGYEDGIETLGSLGGALPSNDVIEVTIGATQSSVSNLFAERPPVIPPVVVPPVVVPPVEVGPPVVPPTSGPLVLIVPPVVEPEALPIAPSPVAPTPPPSAAAPTVVTQVTAEPTKSPEKGVSGRVYVDRNENGTVDSGEEGLAGVTIKVYSLDGKIIATTVTGSDGSWSLPDLAPGDYRVTVVVPQGFKPLGSNTKVNGKQFEVELGKGTDAGSIPLVPYILSELAFTGPTDGLGDQGAAGGAMLGAGALLLAATRRRRWAQRLARGGRRMS